MILFYAPHIDLPHHTLSPEESLHGVKVLRLKKSDTVYVTDGKGTLCTAFVEEPNPRACRLLITDVAENYGARSYHLHMVVAPPKNTDRFEWFVEKATEAGTDTITPLICDRSERKTLKTDRSRRIAIAALKQCKRAQMPEIREPTSFAEFLESDALKDTRPAIACCFTDTPRIPVTRWIAEVGAAATAELANPTRLTVLIGPEGDFSPQEIDAAIACGCTPVDLGPAVLRTETAALGVVFLTAFHFLYL
ncbi:MAG: RsmE family RNA methyltransferase [Bacteroidales bacterium]|jgi:16S rRNA (uracil1498-N3)-methyltransferase|nr:RsmE family RNA methyltransferase [Bacteroidales bacterium]HHV40450.1 16S rRNA (uracil(1498)-N(3))-methyltransferase [Bacteroidales bacterium]